MAIPESQLETWSHQGSVTQSSDTYNGIKKILSESGTPYADKNVGVFLQGSYGNDTNIYAESDVDIVIKLDDCFHTDLSALSDEEKAAQEKAYSDATYTYVEFKKDVLGVLLSKYGTDVSSGSKAINIRSSGNRRKSDVIAAVQFRRYHKFKSIQDQSYTEGICFFDAVGQRIVNYPKQHSANLTSKHQTSGDWVKPMVRILKNMRVKLVKDGKINSRNAPSYFIEGLLYNVPDSKFGKSFEDSFVNAIDWLIKEADRNELVCANEQFYLLREGTHNCWPPSDYDCFIKAICELWNSW